MKPSWDNAPKWANYLAMDSDGNWYWYGNRPFISEDRWAFDSGRILCCTVTVWEDSLEKRPE